MKRVSKMRPLTAQAGVEFVIVAPLFIVTLFLLMGIGLAMFERGVLMEDLSTLGSTLPDDWGTANANDLVRDLILEGSSIDPDNLQVSGASVVEAPLEKVVDNDSVAVALGGSKAVTKVVFVTVKADVTYTFNDILSFGPGQRVSQHVERTYQTQISRELE